jgi:hypothetical protein
MDDINKHPVRMPLNLPEIHEPRCHVCTSKDAEEGVKGALMYRTYLSTALKKAWDDLIEGNVRIDPSVAVQLIQQMDKFDREANSVAVEELTYQFQCFQEAVRKVLPRDLWPQLVETFNELVAQNEIKGLLPSGD